jgi:hypothetical protein
MRRSIFGEGSDEMNRAWIAALAQSEQNGHYAPTKTSRDAELLEEEL